MANIQPEITAFKSAVYGEEVRDAMVSLANKLNTENNKIPTFIESTNQAIESIRTEVAEDIADISLYCKEPVLIDRQIEIGHVNILPSGWSYSNSPTRARLKSYTSVHLVPGDIAEFTDTSKQQRIYYGYEKDGSYFVPEPRWIAGPLNITEEGNYVFAFRATVDSVPLENDALLDAVSNFQIRHYTNNTRDVKDKFIEIENEISSIENTQIQAETSMTYASVSHQGYSHTAPKSTKPAYVESMKKGYRYCENDINKSGDNKLVMWHDSNLSAAGLLYDINGYLMYTDGTKYYGYDSDNNNVYELNESGEYVSSSTSISSLTRLNGTNVVLQETPLAILKHFDLGRYKDDKYAGTDILTFKEWILLCKKLGMDAYIDTKINVTNYISEMVSDLIDLGMLSHVSWVCGASAVSAINIRAQDPEARILVLSEPTDEAIAAYDELSKGRGIAFFVRESLCTEENARKVLRAGYELESWYVGINGATDEQVILDRIEELLDLGVQRITLDRFMIRDIYKTQN